MSALLLALSFAVILAGALLFTNAVEWIGHRLGVGEGAVGSVLAAVGTAMPETLIAIVALLGSSSGSQQVAIGAIVGAPFLLGTLAMGLVGLFVHVFRKRREQGLELRAHVPTLERDLLFFLSFFAGALALSWGAPAALRIPIGIVFILSLSPLRWLTLGSGGEIQSEESLNPLIFDRRAEPTSAKTRAPAVPRPAADRPCRDGWGRAPLCDGVTSDCPRPRRSGGYLGADPRSACNRASREGQQHFLGS